MRRSVMLRAMVALTATVVAVQAIPSIADAAPTTFVVTKTDDTADGTCDADCSLREAVIAAAATPGDDEIEVPAGTYLLTLKGPASVNPGFGDLDIGGGGLVVLRGAGYDETVIDASGLRAEPVPQPDRVFTVQPGSGLELHDLTVTGGHTENSLSADRDGGGIWNRGDLLLDGVEVRGNVAGENGGGLANDTLGVASIMNSTVQDNDTDPADYVTTGWGGGIHNTGELVLRDSTVSANESDWGGGLASELVDPASPPVVEIIDTTIEANRAMHGAGIANIATYPGSDVAAMSIERSVITSNTADRSELWNEGGGLLNLDAGAELTVADTEITANSVTGTGAAVHPKDGSGGGVHNRNGLVELHRVTVAGNVATCEQQPGNNRECGRGGGILNSDEGVVIVESSTISGNSAALVNRTPGDWTGGGNGGGISHARHCDPVCDDPTTVVIDSTVTGNDADVAGGIENPYGDPKLTVQNSIVSGNTADLGGTEDCGLEYVTLGHNLVGEATGCPSGGTGDLVASDAGLGPLAHNGGPTRTHAPGPGSPAIDAGETASSADQRGEPRPRGLADDIGSVEITPSITPGLGVVYEGDTGTVTVDVPVTLSNPSAEPVTVDWTTVDTAGSGIATADVDYVADSGTVTFAPGDVEEAVTITVIGDLIDEPPAYLGEWGLLAFSNPSPNATIDPSFFGIGVFIILDDDP